MMNCLRIVLEKVDLRSFLYDQNSNLTSSGYFKKPLRRVPLKKFIYFSIFTFYLQLVFLHVKNTHTHIVVKSPSFSWVSAKFCSRTDDVHFSHLRF